ncbi:MAG TPA: Na/Pi symporter [Acidimicrobiia bacterium]|nr:Na/Pi symporter [Acidimicrobiia bacterium]
MGDPGIQASERAVTDTAHWTETVVRLGLGLVFLYLFLVGVKALEGGISTFGNDFVDRVFASVANPLSGLAAGVLATVLVQSSSVTTSTIVGLVGSGVLPVASAVPMVMGANIGTTVTNTLASLGHLRQGHYFERAFSAATIHDYFNLIAVAILLPLEVAFGVVSRIATWTADTVADILPRGGTGSSSIKEAISAPVSLIDETIEGLGWNAAAGTVFLVLGLGLILAALWMLTRQMKRVMSGRMENAINAALAKGAGTAALFAGLLMTMAVQSSSITTSLLVPLVAAGLLTLQNAFPITLGANIGTTITAVLASLASDSPDGLVIALAHVTFNVLGILIIYPWPPVRQIPLRLAEVTAAAATRRKSLVAGYVVGLFVIAPLAVLLST